MLVFSSRKKVLIFKITCIISAVILVYLIVDSRAEADALAERYVTSMSLQQTVSKNDFYIEFQHIEEVDARVKEPEDKSSSGANKTGGEPVVGNGRSGTSAKVGEYSIQKTDSSNTKSYEGSKNSTYQKYEKQAKVADPSFKFKMFNGPTVTCNKARVWNVDDAARVISGVNGKRGKWLSMTYAGPGHRKYANKYAWNPATSTMKTNSPDADLVNQTWKGRHIIAVGPKIMIPDYDVTFDSSTWHGVNASDMKYGTFIDVVVYPQSDKTASKLFYIPCVVGDTKAHTYPNFIVQTSVAIVGNKGSAKKDDVNSSCGCDFSQVEFSTLKPRGLALNGLFYLKEIIVYDGVYK